MNIDAREASLQRFIDTLDQVSGTKAEQISVRIQELAKYLDRERQYVEAREGLTDAKQIKRVNKNIKKAVKQFNVNLSQLLGTGKPLTHDAWRLANKQFPELAAVSSMIESHHGLGVKQYANQVIEFTAPQWAEYDERVSDLLIKRGVQLRPGNVDENALGIFKPFHQGGVHTLDTALKPPLGVDVASQAEATVDTAITAEELAGKYKPQGGIIEVTPELASIGASPNAVALEAIARDPSIATEVDLSKRLTEPDVMTPEGTRRLASDLGIPESMVKDVKLSPRMRSLFDFKRGGAYMNVLPLIPAAFAVPGITQALGRGDYQEAAAQIGETVAGEIPIAGDVIQPESTSAGTFESAIAAQAQIEEKKRLQQRAAEARQRGGKIKFGLGSVQFTLPDFGLSELMGIN